MNADREFRVSPGDAITPLWIALRAYYSTRLEQLRVELENSRLTGKETNALRARIAEVRNFLQLDSERHDDIPVTDGFNGGVAAG